MSKFLKAMEILFLGAGFVCLGFILSIPFRADVDMQMGIVRAVGYYSSRFWIYLCLMGCFLAVKKCLTLTINGKMYFIILNACVVILKALLKRINTGHREAVFVRLIGEVSEDLDTKRKKWRKENQT